MKDMTHLSLLDGAFLHLESPEMPMHVGSLALFEAPSPDAGPWLDAVKALVQSRMHLAPVFTRKLALRLWRRAGGVRPPLEGRRASHGASGRSRARHGLMSCTERRAPVPTRVLLEACPMTTDRYACELAKQLPDAVRAVVTLGTPSAGSPRATNAWRLFELLDGRQHREPRLREAARTAGAAR